MEYESYWKLFSKTGRIEDYLKFVECKNVLTGVKADEVFGGSACDKGKEHR